jgi:hypothetical protein
MLGIPCGTCRYVVLCACANKIYAKHAAAAAAPKIKTGRARLQRQFELQSVGRSWPIIRIKLDFAAKTFRTALILL